MKRISAFIWWANLLFVVLTVTGYFSPFVNPSDLWLISLPGLFYPIFLLFHFIFISWWVINKNWRWVVSAATILVGWSYFDSFVGLNFSGYEKTGNDIRILSFNSHGAGSSPINKVGLDEFLTFIKKETPDIICIQEAFGRSEKSSLANHISKNTRLKHTHYSDSNKLLIASAYPIIKSGKITFERTGNGASYVDLNIEGKTVRIFNLHLQSNKITEYANQLAEKTDLQEKETWLTMKNIFGRMRRAARYRSVQADEIARQVEKSPYPVIIAGDFNDPPLSYTYKKIKNGLTDTFKEKGKGLGITFNGSIPALRIDYILVSDEFKTHDFRIGKERQSDHFPITATISWRSEGK